jgi:hypothetical protein
VILNTQQNLYENKYKESVYYTQKRRKKQGFLSFSFDPLKKGLLQNPATAP